jgi:type I restriction enzyme S subunit
MNTVPLCTVADIIMGTAPPGDSYNLSGDGLPLIAGAGDYGPIHPTPKKWTTQPSAVSRPGDLIVCVRATIGDLNWSDREYCLGRGVAALRPRNGKLEPRYLGHFMEARKDSLAALGTGSTFPAIRKNDIETFEIPLPPLPEQKRIADILDKADAIRRKRREVSASIGDYPLSLFMQMFGHPDPNPKDWPMLPFAKVCDSRLGKMLDAKQQTGQHNRPYMRNLNVQWGRLDLSQVFEMDFDESDREEFRLKSGDVLICEGGAGVGQTAIWRDEIPECYFQKSLHRVRPFADKATPEYIAFLMWTLMKGSSLLRSISSATIPHLTGEKLKDVRIPVPPLRLQQHFTKQCQQIAVTRTKAAEGVTGSCDLFNSLVQRAFRGEL